MATDLRSGAALAGSLRFSVMRLARRLRHERSSDDLSLNQLAVLGTLTRNGPTTIGDLATFERVRPPSMTRTVACLEETGLVTRQPHQKDGRQVVVHLTARAKEVIEADRRRRDAWLTRRLAALTPAEREQLRTIAPLLETLSNS